MRLLRGDDGDVGLPMAGDDENFVMEKESTPASCWKANNTDRAQAQAVLIMVKG